jgi:glutamate racemase
MAGIGVFDSGIGGLTVAREIVSVYPEADLVYLGDTARLPYGAKSPETVTRYAINCVRFLVAAGIDVLVVACNTATAHALPALRERFPELEIHGVVDPGARAAVAASQTGNVAVIGTEGTVRSECYVRAIQRLAPQVSVHSLACPLLVPLAEVGWLEHAVTRLTLQTYLLPLLEAYPIDAMVLGCTHYPVLKPAIREVVGDGIALVDSAEAVSLDLSPLKGTGQRRFCVTDLPDRFDQVAATFWPGGLASVEHVDITTG